MCVTALADAGQMDRAAQSAEPLIADANLDGALAFDLATIFFRAAAPKKGPGSKTSRRGGPPPNRTGAQPPKGCRRRLLQRPGQPPEAPRSPVPAAFWPKCGFAKLLEAVDKAPRVPGSGRSK